MGQLVDFLVIGAQKAGTSALHRYLSRHPELFLPEKKELHFFDNEEFPWPGSSKDWDAPVEQDPYRSYHQAFSGAQRGQRWGEVTPIYMYWGPSIARIYRYNPSIKLVIVLRNPITRAFSHWNMERRRGAESLDFLDALVSERERCRPGWPNQHRVFSYADRGHYSGQLKRIWQVFPAEQTLVIKHDCLLHNPANCLATIHNHLGVGQQTFAGEERQHTLPYDCDMGRKAREWLLAEFEDEIRQLEKLLAWDCSDWLKL